MKGYTCQLCGDAFKRSGQLKAHLNKKHLNYKEEVVIKRTPPYNALKFEFRQGSGGKLQEMVNSENELSQSDIQRQVAQAVQVVTQVSK